MPTLLPDKTTDDHETTAECISLTDADDVFEALSAGTARDLLARLHDEPRTASSLAETLDTTLQNTLYHLLQLENAGLVTTIDTWYSEQGREMDVYAPSNEPLVLFAGGSDTDETVPQTLAD